jgi:hypothetical protein
VVGYRPRDSIHKCLMLGEEQTERRRQKACSQIRVREFVWTAIVAGQNALLH